ncbi:MAG TPA: hypothetical protein VGP96_17155 [Candidatus Dormibacteraeota bacterium]|nr:hypothetical protein [Candidatus Dormibacteraeota bacterium]
MEVEVMLRGRRSASALAGDARERGSDIAEGLGSAAGEMGSKAAETMSDLAEKAADLAREAQKAASPVIRSAMATAAGRARDAQKTATPVVRSAAASAAEHLSDAAEHAAEVLAETAGRLAQPADELQLSARERLADASEQLARSIRPRRRRRLRAVLIGTAVVGVAAGVVVSPLGARLRSLVGLGGAASEPAPTAPGIVLPGDPGATTAETDAEAVSAGEPGANGDRVLSGGRTARTAPTE